jgi:hypothetical protein
MDFSERYTPNWKNKTAIARRKCANRCCLCLKRKNYLEGHHVCYQSQSKKKIAGRERIGGHIFPLCKGCHKIAHSKGNWIWDNTNPAKNNRNTRKFKQKLIHGYKLIQEWKDR